jgi:YrbI family 3-deoxy-D-manno-octulosonate 8-phosphate phosphatase
VNNKIDINLIDALIFDFDGVLTNNLVHVDENGMESVSCSRGDGLAFDVLRKINKPCFILSTEKNPVVKARADKLKVPVFQGQSNKELSLVKLIETYGYSLNNILYIGNDLNDYKSMEICGYSACPSDSHKLVKSIAGYTLKSKGGHGVAREILEELFELNLIEILYE